MSEEVTEKQKTADLLDEKAENNEEHELLNIRIPTQTKKSQKRKHIRTDFGADDLDASVLEAQRLEKERLDRLKNIKPQNDHIQQMESLLNGAGAPLPQLDLSNEDFLFGDFCGDDDNNQKRFKEEEQDDTKPPTLPIMQQPSTSKAPFDFVDLTEDSDDDCMITDVRSAVVPSTPNRRMRWAQADKDRHDTDQMEQQQSIEAQRRKKVRSAKDLESTEKCGGRLLVNAGHPASDPDVFVIAHLTHVLQPHQLGGIRFMYDNTIESVEEYKKSPGFGCILAHSMGLGKTIQVITFSEIFLRATKAKKVLIIVPINTIQNWYSEYDKWIPKISDTGDRIRAFEVFLLGDQVKTFDQRVNLIEQWEQKGGVLLIGYDMFRTLIKMTMPKKEKKGRPKLNLAGVSSGMGRDGTFEEQLQRKRDEEIEFETGFTNGGRVRQEAYDLLRRALLSPGPDLVVCDEGHKIKNINAEISTALGSIDTKRRIVLTGYPLQNNLMEYFCMIDFVRPKYLGTRKSFVERFEKPIKNGQCVDSTKTDIKMAMQRTHVLVELVKGFVQRRTHHLLKKILPESKEFVLLIRKSQIQRQLYRNFVLYARNELAKGSNDSTFNPLMAFSACSKIWNHPDILFRVVDQLRKNERAAEEKKRTAELKQSFDMNGGMTGGMNGVMNCGMNLGGGGMMPMGQMMGGYGGIQHQQFPMQHQMQQMNGMMMMPNGMMMQQNNPWNTFPIAPGPSHASAPQLFPQISSNPPTPSTPSGKKPRGRGRPNKKTKSDDDEEEAEKETKMRYDWTYALFDAYQEGVLDNGYKLMISLEILDETTKIGEKVLIFSQNLSALNMLEEVLAKRLVVGKDGELGQRWEKNRNYLRLDGQTNGSEREKLINRFNSEAGLHLFLISTRAGSLGINLVSANRCIIIDACWNPCHDAQAVCRVYRYGQQKKTFIYRLIMDNSMERSIFNRQISKHGLQQRVVDDAPVDANISQKELETLLMYDESQDLSNDKWDTEEWNFGDEILDGITKKWSQLFAGKPFLHESLIMESENTLSEEERKEAQLLFEQEKRLEQYDPLGGLSTSMLQNMTGSSGYPSSMYGNDGYSSVNQSLWSGPSSSMFHPPTRSSSQPHTLRLNVSQFNNQLHHQQPGGHTMTSYNNGYTNNNSPMGMPMRYHAPDPTAFIGAVRSSEPEYTPSRVTQFAITDRNLVLPLVGSRETLVSVPANTEVQLIVPRNGFFIKTNDQTFDGTGSLFHKHAEFLRARAAEKQKHMVAEVIDLD